MTRSATKHHMRKMNFLMESQAVASGYGRAGSTRCKMVTMTGMPVNKIPVATTKVLPNQIFNSKVDCFISLCTNSFVARSLSKNSLLASAKTSATLASTPLYSVLFGSRKTEYIIFLFSFVFVTFNPSGFHVRSLYLLKILHNRACQMFVLWP